MRKVISGDFISPQFTADGKRLILTGEAYRGLWLTDLEGSDPVKIVDESVADFLKSESDEELAELNMVVAKRLPNTKPVLWRGVFWGGTEQAIIGYYKIKSVC